MAPITPRSIASSNGIASGAGPEPMATSTGAPAPTPVRALPSSPNSAASNSPVASATSGMAPSPSVRTITSSSATSNDTCTGSPLPTSATCASSAGFALAASTNAARDDPSQLPMSEADALQAAPSYVNRAPSAMAAFTASHASCAADSSMRKGACSARATNDLLPSS